MKFLQKTPVAILIAVLVVLGSSVVNVNTNLGRKAEAADALWSEKNGMADQLSVRQSSAAQLWSVTNKYDALRSQNDGLRQAYLALADALDAEDVSGAYEASTALTANSAAVLSSLQSAEGVTARDLENAAYYCGLMESAELALEQCGYSEAAAEYQRLISAFPLSLMKPLIRTEAPVCFGEA